MNQQAMNAALLQHDRVRRSTDLPLFYGRKDKDTTTARLMVDRIEMAAEIAGWDNARKPKELYMVLRDRAIVWWNSLDDTDVDKDNWDQVKNNFLSCYEAKYTAKTTCTNFSELVQRTAENNFDYYLRVCEAFARLCDSRPDAMAAVRAQGAVDAAGVQQPAAPADVKMEGIKDAERFFKHQLYLAGLRDDIRGKVMEAGKATLQESVTLANELEVIHQDKRRGQVHAVAITEDDTVNEDDELNEEELAAVNAIRQRFGRQPFRGGARRSGNNKFAPRKPVVCRYCKKTGHMQKECRARIAANAKMVDATGKPFEKKINATSSGEVHIEVKNEPGVGLSFPGAINSLNW